MPPQDPWADYQMLECFRRSYCRNHEEENSAACLLATSVSGSAGNRKDFFRAVLQKGQPEVNGGGGGRI